MTAEEILDALINGKSAQAIWATELQFDNGSSRIDYWTLQPHASKGYLAVSYEIKISRSDFKRDSHKKQRLARLWSDQFYYVTPVGLLKQEEVPDWAGLIEVEHGKCRKVVAAPKRDKDMPSWELVVSLIRNSGRIRRDEDPRVALAKYYKDKIDEARTKMKAQGVSPNQYGLYENM